MKKILLAIMASLFMTSVFAQTYAEYLAQAKDYEAQKKWCYALGAYYDALGTDEAPENKKEAYEGYNALASAIRSGQPGLNEVNVFATYEEWKNLVIDTEKYGSSICKYKLIFGPLQQGDLDYKNQTATYESKVSIYISWRYASTVDVVVEGYKKAYRDDWVDLPRNWPLRSASYKDNNVYNVNGALVYLFANGLAYNAFESTKIIEGYVNYDDYGIDYSLYDLKLNIVDDNGKELAKGNRWLLDFDRNPTIKGITPDVMNLIDQGKAHINIAACYLEYGKYNKAEDKGGISFKKNFPEVQIDINKLEYETSKITQDKASSNYLATRKYYLDKEKRFIVKKALEHYDFVQVVKESPVTITGSGSDGVFIEGRNVTLSPYEIGKYEVTQDLFEAVMGKNPSDFADNPAEGETQNLRPVEDVNWYHAIAFCNKLTLLTGGTTDDLCYSVKVDGTEIDWENLAYDDINSNLDSATVDLTKKGYRLPTEAEWEFAARGGDQSDTMNWNYTYAGSDTIEDVAWYTTNSGKNTHEVGKKAQNSLGIYDMSGNVWEWCYDRYSKSITTGEETNPIGASTGSRRVLRGGSWSSYASGTAVSYRGSDLPRFRYRNGFRLARSL